MRIGSGYDLHALGEGRVLVLGGVKIESDKGEVAHSDGDVLVHAVCDAILGALGRGDIGVHFPDTDAQYKDIPSTVFLEEIFYFMLEDGYRIGNLDCTVILEEPRLLPYRDKITENISRILKTEKTNVNIKAKTKEKLDAVGEGRAVEAYATVLLKEK